jgi:hypothetical protein
MIKPSIPSPAGLDAERVLRPIKETLDIITGARSGELQKLNSEVEGITPSTDGGSGGGWGGGGGGSWTEAKADIDILVVYVNTLSAKIDEIIARINRSGT